MSNKLYSQTDTCFFGNLPEYRIIDKNLAHSLDSIIIAVSSLDAFAILNTEIFAIIYINDTNKLEIAVTPCSCTQFDQVALERDDKFNGFLFIQNHLVLITMKQYESAKLFVDKTDKSRNIFMLNSDNLVYHISPVKFSYSGEIINGEFILETGNETTGDGCDYIYKIQQGDTWEKLAKKFHCSESDLKWNFYTEEKLIPGNYIGWEFFFGNGKTQVWRFR
jgi:hypothetical protein